MSPSIIEWENYINERVHKRPNRVYLKNQEWASKYFPESGWKDFQKTGVEGLILEDAFRDHFIEKMIKPNFKYWRAESQLFDLVACRTSEDAEYDTPWYIWENRNDEHYIGSVKNHLNRVHKEVLDPPPLFPGEKTLYGFEIKTDNDNMYHFLDQLPRYAWLFDRVVLVIGEKQVLPKRLPSWVEVIQRKGDEYVRIKLGSMSHTFLGSHAFNPAKWYMPHHNSKYEDFDYSEATSFSEFIQFLKRCVISALFKTEEVEPYTDIDRAIYTALRERRVKKRVKPDEIKLPTSSSPEPIEEPSKPKSRSLTDFINEASLLEGRK